MCGIVYSHNFDGKPVNNEILQRFDMQRSRGTEGFGIFDGQEMNMIKEANEDKILKWLVKYDSNLILFHHRYPTSTINVKRASHPFSTRDYFGDTQYIFVHNGVIQNSEELYDKHMDMGIKYESQLVDGTYNDSEALAWDFALTLEGKQPELTAYGSIAFICLKTVDGVLERMYFGRNVNPLVMDRNEEGISLSSQGSGETIDTHTLYNYNYKLNRLTSRDFEIPSYDTSYKYEYKAPETQSACTTYSDYDEGYYEHYGLYNASDAEIESCALEYIIAGKGKFETAYWIAEADYELLQQDYVDCGYDSESSFYRKSNLLEDILYYIETHPENKGKDSVSSMWKALWR